MIDRSLVQALLGELGLPTWQEPVARAIEERLQTSAHGDLPRWLRALDVVRQQRGRDTEAVRDALLQLSPWRKGPFDLDGIRIDAEWQSNLKWARILEGIDSLEGQRVLDVGSGNGYYALEMRAVGADLVVGIDPTVLFLVQFAAVQCFHEAPRVVILPLRLEELPLPARVFDTTFSMGVLYHRRSPIDHLRELRQTLKPGGQLVLETLYLPGDGAFARTPENRYARMRNVWLLPTIDELVNWLSRTGFVQAELVDRSVTGQDEQRRTEWMPFESLEAALDPANPERTVEGWPRPHRLVMTATAS
jgi:tRNA (mo5U34)-methyltransferase